MLETVDRGLTYRYVLRGLGRADTLRNLAARAKKASTRAAVLEALIAANGEKE